MRQARQGRPGVPTPPPDTRQQGATSESVTLLSVEQPRSAAGKAHRTLQHRPVPGAASPPRDARKLNDRMTCTTTAHQGAPRQPWW
ncbi:hypothetical protein E2C01_080417 [Portunus trituberculatus]|uniref:Uncharacterized protein n=1 Tax=Portunus trituberculatus TaxID=210409 RepID=A0A5B7IT77_PORTR|nr:hypothetical protein [Portunus trituberculatus]